MGNALSIAAVSRLLRQIVEGNITRYGLDGYVGADVVVTAEPPLDDPDRIRLNLFLYRALESSGSARPGDADLRRRGARDSTGDTGA